MASDDEPVEIKLASTPPRLSEKEKSQENWTRIYLSFWPGLVKPVRRNHVFQFDESRSEFDLVKTQSLWLQLFSFVQASSWRQEFFPLYVIALDLCKPRQYLTPSKCYTMSSRTVLINCFYKISILSYFTVCL